MGTKKLSLAFLIALLAPVLGFSHSTAPVVAHTGGFGEPACNECHFGTGLNAGGGRVAITVSSSSYSSGTTYQITVTDFDPAQRRWGFELTARTQDGKQAGTLKPGTDGFTQIVSNTTGNGITYIGHTSSGTRNGTRDSGSGINFTFSWTAPDTSAGPVEFNAAGNCANGDGTNSGDHIYTTSLTLPTGEVSTAPAPAVNDNGTVNNASFVAGTTPLAPGAIAAIFGTNLNDGSQDQFSAFGSDGTLLTTLGGSSVTFNGIAAPLFNSFPSQVTAEIPMELAGMTTAQVVVTTGGQSSAPKTVPIGGFSPGVFSINQQGTGQGAIQISNTATFAAPSGSISGASAQPANRGGSITIYCTGLGALNNAPATGKPAVDGSSTTTTTPQVTIGGVPATVSFSGLAPGFVSLYQVNVQIPNGAPTGDAVPVVLSIGGVQANTVTIAVQ